MRECEENYAEEYSGPAFLVVLKKQTYIPAQNTGTGKERKIKHLICKLFELNIVYNINWRISSKEFSFEEIIG